MIHRERTFANVGMWFLRCPFPPKYNYNGRSRFFTAFPLICPYINQYQGSYHTFEIFWTCPNYWSSYTGCHPAVFQHLSQGCRERGATLVDWRIWNSHFLDYQVSEYATGPPGFPRVLYVFLCFLMKSPHVSCLQCLLASFGYSFVLKLQSQWLKVRKELALLLKEHFAGNLGCVPISVQTHTHTILIYHRCHRLDATARVSWHDQN